MSSSSAKAGYCRGWGMFGGMKWVEIIFTGHLPDQIQERALCGPFLSQRIATSLLPAGWNSNSCNLDVVPGRCAPTAPACGHGPATNFPASYFTYTKTSLVTQRWRIRLPVQETEVWSLGREDPLEKEMVTHSSILAWAIPWREKPGGLRSMGSQRVAHDLVTEQQLMDT